MFGRCTRLSKECVASSSVRKRTTKATNTSRKTQLEDKLDEVASLLRSQQAMSAPNSVSDTSLLTPTSLADVQADELTEWDLIRFREEHLKDLPFIRLSQDLTAEQLLSEKPLFAQAIHVLCTKAISRQGKLAKRLREQLALEILAEGERSLDLLMCTLVCIAW